MIPRIKERWWGKKRLWLFSGSFKDPEGTTVDVKPELQPDIIANCENVPVPDNSYDLVVADPPYSAEEAQLLYGLDYCSMVKVCNEMARICRPGGHVLLLHRLVPAVHPHFSKEFKRLKLVGIVGVFTIAGLSNMRALTVWRKQETIAEVMSRPGIGVHS